MLNARRVSKERGLIIFFIRMITKKKGKRQVCEYIGARCDRSLTDDAIYSDKNWFIRKIRFISGYTFIIKLFGCSFEFYCLIFSNETLNLSW